MNTPDYHEKYFRLNMDWLPMAGQLEQRLKAQRRLVDKLATQKHDQGVKDLIVSVAFSIEETEALLAWVQKMLNGVGEDAAALLPGSKARTELAWTAQLLGEMMEAKNQSVEEWVEGLAKKMEV